MKKALSGLLALALVLALILGTVPALAEGDGVFLAIGLDKTSKKLYLGPNKEYSTCKFKVTFIPLFDPAEAYSYYSDSSKISGLLTWSSDDPSVAKVNASTGKVTAVSEGKCTITAEVDDGSGTTATCRITVKKENTIEKLKLKANTDTVHITSDKNPHITLKPVFTPEYLYNQKVSYSSSDESIATVSSSGVVTFTQPGEVDITAKSKAVNKDGHRKKATIHLICKPKRVYEFKLYKATSSGSERLDESVSVLVGHKVSVKIKKIKPANAWDLSFTWKSKQPNIATVKNGVIKGIRKGTATIVVYPSNNKEMKQSFRVKVK